MTRRHTEMHPIDAAPVQAFVYLPTTPPASLQRTVYAAAARADASDADGPRISGWSSDSLSATS